MEIFLRMLEGVAALPDWIPLLLLPALLPAGAVLLAALGGRKGYPLLAGTLLFLGFFFVCCEGELYAAFAYMGLFFALSALCFPLTLLPFGRHRREEREERIYKKFGGAELPPHAERPPKVCFFEESPEDARDGGAELGHALSLIARLKREKLAPADRLELDGLARTAERLGAKPLTRTERDALNDCLASVLRLTAKYKL